MKYWENEYQYQRILQILEDYWLSEKDEVFVRVDMHFEKADGQTQDKRIVWNNKGGAENDSVIKPLSKVSRFLAE